MRQHALDDPYPLFTYPEPDWQPDQARRNIICDGEWLRCPPVAFSGLAAVQRDIMKNRVDPVVLENGQHFISHRWSRHKEVEDVPVMDAVRRNARATNKAAVFGFRKGFVIIIPGFAAVGRKLLRGVKLCVQESRRDLTRYIGRTQP